MRASRELRSLFDRAIGTALGLLLAIQVALSFFPVTVATADGLIQVVICGHDGLQSITIQADGTPAPSSEVGAGKCPFCLLGFADLVPAVEPAVREFARHDFVPSGLGDQLAFPQRLDPAAPIRAPPAAFL